MSYLKVSNYLLNNIILNIFLPEQRKSDIQRDLMDMPEIVGNLETKGCNETQIKYLNQEFSFLNRGVQLIGFQALRQLSKPSTTRRQQYMSMAQKMSN